MLWLGTGDGGGAATTPSGHAQDLGVAARQDPADRRPPATARRPATRSAARVVGLRAAQPVALLVRPRDRRPRDRRRRPGPVRGDRLGAAPPAAAGRELRLALPRGHDAHESRHACQRDRAPSRPRDRSSRSDGYCAIVGGYVVRDPGLPRCSGRYLYGDNCRSGAALGRRSRTRRATRRRALAWPGLSSFGEDACGRLYAASSSAAGLPAPGRRAVAVHVRAADRRRWRGCRTPRRRASAWRSAARRRRSSAAGCA